MADDAVIMRCSPTGSSKSELAPGTVVVFVAVCVVVAVDAGTGSGLPAWKATLVLTGAI